MYIWNKKALEQKLIDDSLTEREKFSYVFALIFSYVLGSSIAIFFPEEVSEIAVLGQVFMLILTAIGIIWCFQINQSGDGTKFVERFVCIGWVMSIRVLAMYLIFLIVASVIFSLADREGFDEILSGPSIILDILLIGILTIIYYWRVSTSIAVIANAKRIVNELD